MRFGCGIGLEVESELGLAVVVGPGSIRCILYLVCAEDVDLWNVASIVSSGILDKSLGGIGEKSPEKIFELVPIGIGEIIPEGITGEKSSCWGLGS